MEGNRAERGFELNNITQPVRSLFRYARENPRETVAFGAFMLAIGSMGIFIPTLGERSNQQFAERAAAQATATALAAEDLRRDYSETGGINLIRQRESYLVSLRASSSLAASDSELLDIAWARIRQESGCQPVETFIQPEISGHPLPPPGTPKSIVVRISC